MPSRPARTLALTVAAPLLAGCYAAEPPPAQYGLIGGVAPLPTLAESAADPIPPASSRPSPGIMDRSDWAPTPLVVPSDLVLHPPHATPLRLPVTGDSRYHGAMPTELTATRFGSGNRHQLKSLAYEPFLVVADLFAMPVRLVLGPGPHELAASPSPHYQRAPHRWRDALPNTGRPTGPVGGEVNIEAQPQPNRRAPQAATPADAGSPEGSA